MQDPTSEERKKNHIELAFDSQTDKMFLDKRFNYEPILSGHVKDHTFLSKTFLGKDFKAPIWVSSMTGGTELAGRINKNLAIACKEFGMGMGLGSCRRLLEDEKFFEDFNLRKYIGDQPLYTNLGIAQIEILLNENKTQKINELIKKLDADGLIIHVNPLQEWLQPEGDRYYEPPIETIKRLLDKADYKIIIKEVGHGMGPQSLKQLMQLPIEAIDFAAFGGTNFSKIELMRGSEDLKNNYDILSLVGHAAEEMIEMVNTISDLKEGNNCNQIIISGGIKNFLDGYYFMSKCKLNSIFGMASSFLNYAKGDYETLQAFVRSQIDGLALASKILTVK